MDPGSTIELGYNRKSQFDSNCTNMDHEIAVMSTLDLGQKWIGGGEGNFEGKRWGGLLPYFVP